MAQYVFGTSQAAKALSVTRQTIHNWINHNMLHPLRVNGNGHMLLFDRKELEALKHQKGKRWRRS